MFEFELQLNLVDENITLIPRMTDPATVLSTFADPWNMVAEGVRPGGTTFTTRALADLSDALHYDSICFSTTPKNNFGFYDNSGLS